jgi:ABC-2 type transport system ATP-binding protein
MTDPILTTHDLKKSFGEKVAVKGISFDVQRGEIFSLLGPNGAGKTTTISMVCCLLKPTDGSAVVDGHTIPGEEMAVKKVIGVVPQEIALYDELTAAQNLSFWGQMHGMGGKPLKKRIDEVLDQTGLRERAGDRVKTFSGGMKRRLNIGVGLLHEPKLLFMDEPTVGIDPQSRRQILESVKQLKDEGMTVVYTTHYMEEAEELSNRVGIIDRGELIAIGTQAELTEIVGEQETLRLSVDEGYDPEAVLAHFQDVPGVLHTVTVDGQIVLNVNDASETLPAVVTAGNNADIRIRSVDIEEPNLEAVFLHLTGRALRD